MLKTISNIIDEDTQIGMVLLFFHNYPKITIHHDYLTLFLRNLTRFFRRHNSLILYLSSALIDFQLYNLSHDLYHIQLFFQLFIEKTQSF